MRLGGVGWCGGGNGWVGGWGANPALDSFFRAREATYCFVPRTRWASVLRCCLGGVEVTA